MNMKESMRKGLLIAATVALAAGGAYAAAPKDNRFANPSDPEGLRRSSERRQAAVQKQPQVFNAAPQAGRGGSPRDSARSSGNGRSNGGDRSSGSRGSGRSDSRSNGGNDRHSSDYGRSSHDRDSHNDSHHDGVSLSIGLSSSHYGGGYSSYGHYDNHYPSYSPAYGHHNYGYGSHYYPSYGYYGHGYGSHYYPSYGHYGYGYPYYSNRLGSVYPSYSPTVILYESTTNYGDTTGYSASSDYRGSRNGPWPYETGQYQAQAQPTQQEYQDWQRSTGQGQATAGAASVRGVQPGDMAQSVTPSDRQVEALRQGWSLVAQGKAKEAVTVFAVECEADARLAQSKIGYAIASALAGETAAAKWGIRRAFGLQSDGLAYLPAVEGLTDQMNGLSRLLWSSMGGRAVSADDWFLLASVDYLRHDLDSARKAAQEATDLGDNSPSLRNLRSQIAAESGN